MLLLWCSVLCAVCCECSAFVMCFVVFIAVLSASVKDRDACMSTEASIIEVATSDNKPRLAKCESFCLSHRSRRHPQTSNLPVFTGYCCNVWVVCTSDD
eukprot:scaffold9738_cov131-Alexandrium_tamarense.AAC.1